MGVLNAVLGDFEFVHLFLKDKISIIQKLTIEGYLVICCATDTTNPRQRELVESVNLGNLFFFFFV
jgi:hypothetical protein